MYNGNGGENLSISNFVKIHKEKGKEMKELKDDAMKYCSNEFEFFKLLNKIVNANTDKKTERKQLKNFLLLPSSPEKIFLPTSVINRTKRYSTEDFGRDEYIRKLRWRINEARQDCDNIKNP